MLAGFGSRLPIGPGRGMPISPNLETSHKFENPTAAALVKDSIRRRWIHGLWGYRWAMMLHRHARDAAHGQAHVGLPACVLPGGRTLGMPWVAGNPRASALRKMVHTLCMHSCIGAWRFLSTWRFTSRQIRHAQRNAHHRAYRAIGLRLQAIHPAT